MAVWTMASARAVTVGPGGSLRTDSRASSFQTRTTLSAAARATCRCGATAREPTMRAAIRPRATISLRATVALPSLLRSEDRLDRRGVKATLLPSAGSYPKHARLGQSVRSAPSSLRGETPATFVEGGERSRSPRRDSDPSPSDYSRFSAVHRIPPSVVLAGQVGCLV